MLGAAGVAVPGRGLPGPVRLKPGSPAPDDRGRRSGRGPYGASSTKKKATRVTGPPWKAQGLC